MNLSALKKLAEKGLISQATAADPLNVVPGAAGEMNKPKAKWVIDPAKAEKLYKGGLITEDTLKRIQGFANGGVVVEDPLAKALQIDPLVIPQVPIEPPPPAAANVDPGISSLALTQEQAEADRVRIAQEIEARRLAEAELAKQKESAASQPSSLSLITPEYQAALAAEKSTPSLGVGDKAALEQQELLKQLASFQEEEQARKAALASQAQPAASNLMGEANSIVRQASAAARESALVQEQAALEQARLYEEQSRALAEAAAKFQEKYDALSLEREEIIKEVKDGKIEPNRLFSSMSDGNKAMMAIGLVLSSVSAGMRGTQNEGLMLLDRFVTRDIEAQKAELGKKQTLLSLNLQATNDLRQAEQMTRLQMGAALEARIQQLAAQSNSKQAKANAELAIAKIRSELLPIQQKIAAEQTAVFNPALVQQLPFDQAYFALPEKIREQAVKLPGNRLGIAVTPTAAKKISEALPAMEATIGTLEELLDDSKWRLFPTEEKGRLQSKATQILLDLRALKGTGALDNGTIMVMEKIIGDPNAFFQSESRARSRGLLNSLRRDKDLLLRQNVIGYQPSQVQFTPVK